MKLNNKERIGHKDKNTFKKYRLKMYIYYLQKVSRVCWWYGDLNTVH